MSPAHELALYLEAEGVGTFAEDIHVSREPASPDNVVTLYDTGGSAPANYDIELRQPTIQVRVRHTSYTDAVAKQEEIFEILNAIKTQVIGANTYLGAWMTTDILSIGRDDNDRHLLTANYQVQRG